jgi:type IV secretory pathway VirB10-like protein
MSTTIEEELQKEQDLESHQDENGKVKLPKKADRKKVVIVSLVSIFFLFIVLTSIISPGGSKKKVSNEQSTKSNITLLEDSLNLLKNRQNDIMITEPQISNLAGLEEMKMSQNKILNEQSEIMSRLQKLENLRNESLNENRGPVLDKYAMRFEQTNQQLNNFVKGNVGRAWRMSDEDLNEMNSSSHLKNVNNELLNLQENTLSMIGGEGSKIIFPAGTRIEMVTESEINSDYPGYVTAKVFTPYQLKGWKAILRHNGQVNNRISASIEKVINVNASREYTVSGQVEMNFPGLVGKVKNHWAKRVIPELVAASIGAGYVAYEVQRQANDPRGDTAGLRIDSRDAYVGTVAQQTVSSAQGEARRFGGDVPNTVTVPQGERFWFLLTQPLSVEL